MNYKNFKRFSLVGLSWLLASAPSYSQDGLLQLDLKELLDLEITSVSKKPQTVSKSAAAIFVITAEDIRRMGAQSIPDALRIAPGLQVAQVSANAWAVTARGANGRFANKLLVLVDGRTVYSPLFSGVFWDVQDTVLADVERIEVIRGPGAVVWGANAANGVINIITKSAAATQGGLVEFSTSSQENGSVSMRYGGQLEELGYYRLYAKGFDRQGLTLKSSGNEGYDSWQQQRLGGRADLTLSGQDALTVQGELYQGSHGESALLGNQQAYPFYTTAGITQQVSGGHLLLRWQRELADTNSLTVQTYLDRTVRYWPAHPNQSLDTLDADVQYRHRAIKGHDFVLGMSYRLNRDQISSNTDGLPDGTLQIADIATGSVNSHNWSALVQDDITLVPDTLVLTLGAKLEKFDANKPVALPNTRLLWTPSQTHTFWGSVSKALRTPSRLDQDSTLRTLAPSEFEIGGSRLPLSTFLEISGSMKSETLWAYELGWKHRWTPQLTTDISAFVNDYADLRSGIAQTVLCQPSGQVLSSACFTSFITNYLLVPVTLSNDAAGRSKGVEVWLDWQPSRQHRVQASLTRLDMNFTTSNPYAYSVDSSGSSPQWSGSVRWSFTPRPDLELDMTYRQVDQLSDVLFGQTVPGYKALDLRWAWRTSPKVQWQVVGRNLLTSTHQEFISETGDTAESQLAPSIGVGVSIKF